MLKITKDFEKYSGKKSFHIRNEKNTKRCKENYRSKKRK